MAKALEQLYELSFAIFSLDYEKVEQFLADESFPVNLFHPRFSELPKDQAMSTYDRKMIHLFLNCPRIDWLKKSELNYDDLDSCGIDYDEPYYRAQKKKSKVDDFKCLVFSFESQFPEEAKLIYDKMFEALQQEPEEDLERLFFNCLLSTSAFERSLQFVKDINKRTHNEDTILHRICYSNQPLIDQAQKVIEMGADVDAKNLSGWTPLKCLNREKNPDLAELLLASTTKATEEEFRAYLKESQKEPPTLKPYLEENPQFEEIFKEDLPGNLARFHKPHCVELFKQLRPKDGMSFLKAYIFDGNTDDTFSVFDLFDQSVFKGHNFKNHEFLASIVSENANELLHLAVESSNLNWIEILIRDYQADPNSVIDGLTPLFKVQSTPLVALKFNEDHAANSSRIIDFLLKSGADPLIEVDGCKFFQRSGFVCPSKSFSWLFNLHKRGIDIFEASPATGKTFFEDSTATLGTGDVIDIKASVMTKALFLQLCSNEADFSAPIDDEANTILHYFCLGHLKLLFTPKTEELSESKNKTGFTPLQLLVRSNDFLDTFMRQVKPYPFDKLVAIEAAYDEAHGKGSFCVDVLKKRGAQIFMLSTQEDLLTLAKYLLHEHRLSPEQLGLEMYNTDSYFSDTNGYFPIGFFGPEREEFMQFLITSGLDCIDALHLLRGCSSTSPIYEYLALEKRIKNKSPERIFFDFLMGCRDIHFKSNYHLECLILPFVQMDGMLELFETNKFMAAKFARFSQKFLTDSLKEKLLLIGLDLA